MTLNFIFVIFSFFVMLYGLGSLFLFNRPVVEKLALGLAVIPITGVILNILHIPLDWRIFLALSLAAPVYEGVRWWKEGRRPPSAPIRIKRPSWQTALVLIVLVFAVVIYCWGPFQYPWLENDDPWSHAAGIKYIALEKNLNAPSGMFQYLNPYPPGYDLIFGILHQVSPSIYWTMKFFNGIIICLGFLFFFAFARELTQNKSKAAFAVLFLAVIPCYLTHFIWAHSLVVTLFYPAFLFILKSFKDKRYILPAALCCAAITLTQPTQPIKFAVMAALMILAFGRTKIQWKNLLSVAFISTILSLLWWGPVLTETLVNKSKITLRDHTQITGSVVDTAHVAKHIFDPAAGSATQAYSWQHFLFIADPNLINNPTGLTPFIAVLAFIGIIFSLIKIIQNRSKQESAYLLTILLWLIFTFLGINSMTFNLPVGLFAFRFWMLFAIPIVFLCAETLCCLERFLQFRWNKLLIISLFIIAVLRSTIPFKWWFNTSEWSFGMHWDSDDDITGYTWMRKTLPVNTKVFAFTDNVLVLGHDMRADFWTDNYKARFSDMFNQDTDTLYKNLKEKNYDCLIVSPRDIWKFGKEEVNIKLKALYQDPRFRIIFTNKAVKIFQILGR